jgi:hypothetical protein
MNLNSHNTEQIQNTLDFSLFLFVNCDSKNIVRIAGTGWINRCRRKVEEEDFFFLKKKFLKVKQEMTSFLG